MQISPLSAGTGFPTTSTTTAVDSAPSSPAPVEEGSGKGKKPKGDTLDIQRGVIRNLMAGHFQGVADVRLRINFHDELQALTSPPDAGVDPDAPATEPMGDLASGEPVSDAPLADASVDGEATDEEVPAPGLSLPPLSPPRGNGKAYAKFLAIYEELRSGTEAPSEGDDVKTPDDSVDVTA